MQAALINTGRILGLIALFGFWTNVSTADAAGVDSTSTREVVVSASRTEMEVKDAPASVVVISREQIVERQANNLADVLRDVVGIQFSKSGSLSSGSPLRIRGSEADHVLILIDGKRLSMDPSFQNTRELERIRMDDVERVELVKGPASALYGSSAMGGVINIITRRPTTDTTEVYINHKSSDASSLQTNMGVYLQGAKRGNFSWTLAAARNYTSNLSFAPGQQEYPSGTEVPINFKGIWEFDADNSLQLDLRYIKEHTEYDLYYKNPLYTPYYMENDITRWDYGLEYKGKSEEANWQLRWYRSNWEKDQDSYRKGSRVWYDFDLIKSNQDVFEGQLTRSLSERHLVSLGGMFTREWIESTRLLTGGVNGTGADSEHDIERNGVTKIAGKKNRDNYALYLQDEWKINNKWLLIPAVRVEEYEDFSAEVTPRLGITYFVKPGLRLKANVATGYRAPTLLELYRYTTPTGMRGNPKLQPETSVSAELSVEKDWQRHSAKLAIYRNEVEDLIVMERQAAGYYMNVNVDETLLQGVELSTKHRLTPAVNLYFGYSYLHAENSKTNTRLRYRPQHQFVFGGAYQAKDAWKLSMDGNILTDYVYTDNFGADHRASYLIFNLLAERKFGKDKAGLFYCGVENLFDKQIHDLSEYGRTYVVGTSYKF